MCHPYFRDLCCVTEDGPEGETGKGDSMKALTICQPYAELIACGEKRIENRRWGTSYRGPLAIHAGKSQDWLETYDPLPADMDFGAVVAIAQLAACTHISSVERWLAVADHEDRYGWIRYHVHAEGPWLWILEDVRRLGSPIEISGKQGLWDWRPPLALAFASSAK